MVNNAKERKGWTSTQGSTVINKKFTEGHESIVCIDSNGQLLYDNGDIEKSYREYKLKDSLDYRHSGI